MKQAFVIIAITTFSPLAQALDGHNGITFNMSQRQVEKKGFICQSQTKDRLGIIARCLHMDMTGVAFGVPTQNYEVEIDSNKRVASIQADLIGIRTLADYLALHNRIDKFFPKKDESRSFAADVGRLDFWRDKDNSGISVYISPGVRGITKDTKWVTFWSPANMAAFDKIALQQKKSKGSAEK